MSGPCRFSRTRPSRVRGGRPMSNLNQCPECHRDLAEDSPKGLCPACLMGMALCETPKGSDLYSSDETDVESEFVPEMPSWASDPYRASDLAPVESRDRARPESGLLASDSHATRVDETLDSIPSR